jgi:hypothetical protein
MKYNTEGALRVHVNEYLNEWSGSKLKYKMRYLHAHFYGTIIWYQKSIINVIYPLSFT